MPEGPHDQATLAPERTRLVAAVTWGAAYQVFEVAASFAAMLVLVRVIPPSEYGRAAAAVGVLGLLHTFSAHAFVEHALQTPGERQPDWSLYWTLAWYTQVALFVACQLIAAACWTASGYRPLAPLLHVAGCGMLVEAPNEISVTMLRRDLALRRLKTIAAISVTIRLVAMIAIALAGFGAWALIIGGNILSGLPFVVDLLIVRRWRPHAGWWRLPDRAATRPATAFAAQQMTSRILSAVRSACEAAVLPSSIGFGAMGLLNRAQALYGSTVGRASAVLIDSVYPVLPRVKDEPERFARRATVFVQVLLLLAIAGGLFLGLEGRALSRVVYGSRWIAMDPLIWPGAVTGASVAVFASMVAVLVAAGQLRRCVQVEAAGLLLVAPPLLAAVVRRSTLEYAAAVAVADVVAATLAVRAAAPLLVRDWRRRALSPPIVAGGSAAAVAAAARTMLAPVPQGAELAIAGTLFILALTGVLVFVFPDALAAPLQTIRRLDGFTSWLQRRAARRVSALSPAEVPGRPGG